MPMISECAPSKDRLLLTDWREDQREKSKYSCNTRDQVCPKVIMSFCCEEAMHNMSKEQTNPRKKTLPQGHENEQNGFFVDMPTEEEGCPPAQRKGSEK